MGEQVEHADAISPKTHRHEHIAKLRAGGISDDALDVVLDEANGCGEKRGDGTDDDDEGLRVRGQFIKRRQAGDEEHASSHHRGGVDKRGNRRRAFHRVRQPSVQQELGGFAHGTHEQQEADDGERVEIAAEEMDCFTEG